MATRSAPTTGHPFHHFISRCREYVSDTLDLGRTIAFWTAVTLPWVLLAFVLAGVALERPFVFVTLLTVNLISGILGHNYGT